MSKAPRFEQATERTLAFLRDQSIRCDALRWVFREDFYFVGPESVLAPRLLQDTDDQLARRLYEKGAASPFGVRIKVEFTDGKYAYCWILICDDERTALELWMPIVSGLSIGVRSPIARARMVNSWSWALRRRFSRHYGRGSAFVDLVPSRASMVA